MQKKKYLFQLWVFLCNLIQLWANLWNWRNKGLHLPWHEYNKAKLKFFFLFSISMDILLPCYSLVFFFVRFSEILRSTLIWCMTQSTRPITFHRQVSLSETLLRFRLIWHGFFLNFWLPFLFSPIVPFEFGRFTLFIGRFSLMISIVGEIFHFSCCSSLMEFVPFYWKTWEFILFWSGIAWITRWFVELSFGRIEFPSLLSICVIICVCCVSTGFDWFALLKKW